VLCTDDSVLAGPNEAETNQIIKEMQQVKSNITAEGDWEDFLSINVDRKKEGTTNLMRPHLIDLILKDLRLEDKNITAKDTPASLSKTLRRHAGSKPLENSTTLRKVAGVMHPVQRTNALN
jgi:hypothetical protein